MLTLLGAPHRKGSISAWLSVCVDCVSSVSNSGLVVYAFSPADNWRQPLLSRNTYVENDAAGRADQSPSHNNLVFYWFAVGGWGGEIFLCAEHSFLLT